MSDEQPQISVVTDISANIFAVFIIILIVLLAAPHDAPPPPAPAEPIEVKRDLAAVTRTPLDAGGLVSLLFEQRSSSASLKVDLFADRIDVAAPGQPPLTLPLPLDERAVAAVKPLATAGRPIGLYVFDHRGYAAVTGLLAGRPFREVSVPRALRSGDVDRQDWSAGFRRLSETTSQFEPFREDLARLLAAPEPSRAESAARRSARLEAARPPREMLAELTDRLAGMVRHLTTIFALVAGVGFIAGVEIRARRRAR